MEQGQPLNSYQSQAPQNPQNPQPSSSPAKKTFLSPLIIFVLLMIVGVSGIILGKSLSSPKPLASPTSSVLPTLTPDKTANWKTYKNEKYGFQVKYSPDLFPREAPEGKTQKVSVSFGTLKDGYSFAAEVFEKNNIGYYRNQLEDHVTGKLDTEEIIFVDGLKGTKFTYLQFLSTDYTSFSQIIVPNGNLDYIITAKTSDFDQILSTFKFLE